MENVPFAPATLVCGTKVCALSASDTVSVPPVVSGALVSDSATVADESTAASFVPLIVTCTVLVVPSAEATVNVSDTDCPTLRLSNALLAVERGGVVSESGTGGDERTAALFEPLIVTCTVLVVPSADATVKLSDTDWPTLRLAKVLLAV